jgi:mono/diheme cytochrome c family protein
MKSPRLLFLALGAFTLVGAACALHSFPETIPADWEQTGYIERGNYLVNYLGHCVGCHTPLGTDGESDMNLVCRQNMPGPK